MVGGASDRADVMVGTRTVVAGIKEVIPLFISTPPHLSPPTIISIDNIILDTCLVIC